MESIRKEISVIETNKDKINQCKDFNYKFKKPEIKKKIYLKDNIHQLVLYVIIHVIFQIIDVLQ
jgi:hypothetical protein